MIKKFTKLEYYVVCNKKSIQSKVQCFTQIIVLMHNNPDEINMALKTKNRYYFVKFQRYFIEYISITRTCCNDVNHKITCYVFLLPIILVSKI